MKNFELIAKLQSLPPELDVALVDVRLNYSMQDPGGDIVPGVYDQIEVAQQNYEDGSHWISILFVNPMVIIDDEDKEESDILQPAHGGLILPTNFEE